MVCTRYILCGIILSLSTFSYAQNVAKLEERAEALFYDEDFTEALKYYNEILAVRPKSNLAKYKIEICSLLTCCTSKSLDKFLSYQNTKGRSDKFYYYWLGRIYLEKYKFDDAITAFQKFQNLNAYKSKIITEETEAFIEYAKHGKTFFDERDEYEIHPMGHQINTSYDELSPVYFPDSDELLFTSDRNGEGASRNEQFAVYHSIRENGEWTEPTLIDNLGRFPRNLSNIEVINKDKKLYVYGKPKGEDLFESHPAGHATWTRPDEFDPKISHIHLKSNFYISPEEDHVIFTSAKDYKANGFDLYESFRDPGTGKWSKPSPLSSLINSTEDEDSPYITKDGKTLYFASTGHNSIGNYDIFKASYNEETKTWNAPENMGYPINTPGDETSFKINDDLRSGYFSSNRYGSKGEHDIFFFWNTSDVDVRGVVTDLDNNPVPGVVVKFIPEGHTNEEFIKITDDEGKYHITTISDEFIDVEILREGEVLKYDTFQIDPTKGIKAEIAVNFQVDISKIINKKQEEIINPSEVLTIQDEIVPIEFLGNKFRKGDRALTRNIYFDYASSSIKVGSDAILLRLLDVMNKNPELVVEIQGHTDNSGSTETNLKLSNDRAKSVAYWLVMRGVDAKRLKTRGFGESKPLASNDDEKMGRELNRRIELRVIE